MAYPQAARVTTGPIAAPAVPLDAAAPGERYVFLDGLRGLAALAIVVHHFTADSGSREVFASASIAVDFFFCLSGFVISHAYHLRLLGGMRTGEYATKRLARLYPMYFIGTLFGLLAIMMLKARGLTDFSWGGIGAAAFLNLSMLPFFNANYIDVFTYRLTGTIFPLNNPAWSLFFGFLANLIYASTIRFSRAMPFVLMVVSALGLCASTALWGEAPGWGTHNFIGGFPRVLFSFFAGVVIFQAHDRTQFLPRFKPAAIALLIVVLVAMPRFVGHKIYWLTIVLVLVPVLVAMGTRCVIPGGFWEKACGYSGRMSYPMFCVHYPLLMLMSTVATPAYDNFFLLVVFVIATIGLSHVALTYFEDPVRSWLKHRVVGT
jgi:peptidoglycan/LPS O-acetylase OafA/YrhL